MSSSIINSAGRAFLTFSNHYAVGTFFLSTTALFAARYLSDKYYNGSSDSLKDKILGVFLKTVCIGIIGSSAVASFGLVGKGVVIGSSFGMAGSVIGGALGALISLVNAYSIYNLMSTNEDKL